MNPLRLTRMQTLHVTRSVSTVLTLLFLLVSFASMKADVNDCTCSEDSLLKGGLSICIDGTNYSVDVYGCKRVLNVYPYLDPLCEESERQNQITTITQVCFLGAKPVPIDPVATFEAILCELDPCKTPGVMGAFVPPVVGSIYCWTILLPKCLRVYNNTGCIVKCNDGCCIIARRWARQTGGVCVRTGIWRCETESSSCEDPCEIINCVDPRCCP